VVHRSGTFVCALEGVVKKKTFGVRYYGTPFYRHSKKKKKGKTNGKGEPWRIARQGNSRKAITGKTREGGRRKKKRGKRFRQWTHRGKFVKNRLTKVTNLCWCSTEPKTEQNIMKRRAHLKNKIYPNSKRQSCLEVYKAIKIEKVGEKSVGDRL